MSLTNPNHAVTAERLQEFYNDIFPYLNGPEPENIVYGMRILRDESVPSSKVVYLGDTASMTPAHMDCTNNVFDYGSWGNAFFMPQPCMLKYDGTVDYYLDPNDYTKKEDGTASDVANTSYEGNAMMEWPKIWLKIVPDSTKDNKEADIFISNKKLDNKYTDWPYHNANGDSVEHFYTPIYNGSLIDGKLRSISGQATMKSKTVQQELDYALANNPSGEHLWTTEVIADIDLINILLMLIGKSTNGRVTFGMGLNTNGSEMTINNFRTGVHNAKGLFYGTNSGDSSSFSNAVKIFGMENWWGFIWRRYLGEVMISGSRKRKLTYGQEDGSTTTGYNFTGEGYISSNVEAPSGSHSGESISQVKYTNLGLFPVVSNGSNTTYYVDSMGWNNENTNIPIRGGRAGSSWTLGPFCVSLGESNDTVSWTIGVALSCKPNTTS